MKWLRHSAFVRPTHTSAWVDDGDDFLDYWPEPRAKLQQLGPFCWGYFNPFGKFVAEHPILSFEIFDNLDELFIGCPGQEQQERVDESLHGSEMRNSLVELEVS